MKMNPNSPKHQASIRRWNTYQARKRLERKVQTCFAPDSRFYTLPLDLHRFKLTPDLLFWHWRAAFIAPLRERLSQYAPPLPLLVVMFGIPAGCIVGTLKVLIDRIEEIGKGEEDAYRNY